jgi:pimeloyl-ACP methyl ester carboxylesterase
VRTSIWLGMAAVVLIPATTNAGPLCRDEVTKVNARISGRVVDYTHNHGYDRRFFAPCLNEKRDMYVYLPPGFNPNLQYPVMIYLHGILDDEKGFLAHVVQPLDEAIACGKLPPMIVAAPDGSLCPDNNRFEPGSFFINGPRGDFQDFIICDVWNFLINHYPIRPEARAHILAGVSMGGFGAYNIALKHRDTFGIVVGVLPVLNVRWMDCKGDYMADFDPYNWGWRNTAYDPNEVVGSFMHDLVKLRMKDLLYPAFGEGCDGMCRASCENPIELIDRTWLKPGELDMYIGYARNDEFNLDAQAESFIYLAKSRGICPTVLCDENGHHNELTAARMMPDIICWLGNRMRFHHVDQPLPVPVPVRIPTTTKPAAAK